MVLSGMMILTGITSPDTEYLKPRIGGVNRKVDRPRLKMKKTGRQGKSGRQAACRVVNGREIPPPGSKFKSGGHAEQ